MFCSVLLLVLKLQNDREWTTPLLRCYYVCEFPKFSRGCRWEPEEVDIGHFGLTDGVFSGAVCLSFCMCNTRMSAKPYSPADAALCRVPPVSSCQCPL